MKELLLNFYNDHKKVLLISLLVALIILFAQISYGYYLYTAIQQDTNVLNADCFDITLTSSNDISLQNAFPLTDAEAQNLTPYTFKIKNICTTGMDFEVNIEALDGTTLSNTYLRYKLNNEASKILGSQGNGTTLVNDSAISSKTIATGFLMPNEERTYNLRMWITESATSNQVGNTSYVSKVVAISTMNRATQGNNMMYAPGLYDSNGQMVYSWQQLLTNNYLTVVNDSINASNQTYITGKLVIDNSVTSIGNSAFASCTNLTSVIIESASNLNSIGYHAFYNTGITSITIPRDVETIGEDAFYGITTLNYLGDAQDTNNNNWGAQELNPESN